MSSLYDPVATFYDLLHEQFVEDIPFWLETAGAPPATILELACGTGRLTLPLAEAGHHLVALDHSQPMLLKALRRLRQQLAAVQDQTHLVQADMRRFAFQKLFEHVFISNNTLLHIATLDLVPCLKCVARHLHPRGRLTVDLANPLALLALRNQAEPLLERVFPHPDTGLPVYQTSRFRVDAARQQMTLTYTFAGEGIDASEVTLHYWIRLPHQLEIAAHIAGLGLVAQYGSYDRRPFDEDSERYLVVLEKG